MNAATVTTRTKETGLLLWMFAVVFALLAVTAGAFAQPLTGTKTVGGSYPNYSTIAAAISDLNTKGVGTGGVTFNVRTGHTETAVNLVLTTTTASASNPVIFQRSGSGSNPRIKAGTGTGSADGIIEFQGTDYVTFDGIDVVEDSTNNTTDNKRMEWGYGIFRASGTDASHHITIKNCNVTLKWNAPTVVGGIVIDNHNATSVSTIAATSANGVSSDCIFDANIIKNAYNGYYLDGDNGSYQASGNIVRSTLSANGQVLNYGGGSTAAYGVYVNNQKEFRVEDIKITNGRGSNGVYGVYLDNIFSATSAGLVEDLTISSIRSNGSAIYGIFMNSASSGGPVTIGKNKIYDVSSSGSGAIVTGALVGNGGTTTVANNQISDITAPSASNKNAVRGIHVQGSGSVNVYYNTVYLNATSSASTFGSSALFAANGTGLVLRNNVLVNASTAKGVGGYDAAYRRDGAGFSGYDASSNNNLFYAGSWSDTTNVLYYDGSHKTRCRDPWQVRYWLYPRENLSFMENPPFSSLCSKPYNLKMKTNSSTQVESGARRIVGVGIDFEGTVRQGESGYSGSGTYPDAGSDEGNLRAKDIVPPVVTYAPTNMTSTSLTNFTFTAAITDPSGVKTSNGQGPRVYYRKKGQNNSHSGNTSSTNGWKYNVSSSSSSPYTFVVDYSKLYGGHVAVGDTIEYFIVAIDNAGNVATFNVYPNMTSGNSTSCGSFGPANANLTPNDFPIFGDPFTVRIAPATNPSLSGLITVGVGGQFPNLTEAFNYAKQNGLSGNVTFAIISNITEPAGTPTLNTWPEFPTGSNFTVNIQPMGGQVWTINGSGSSVINLTNADRVTIDGLNTGGNGLIINNTSTNPNTAGVVIGSPTGQNATNITIQNVTITGNPGAAYPTYGILVSDGTVTTANPGYNVDNLTIRHNTVTGFDYGIYINGATTATSDNLVITGNTVGGPAAGQEISTVGITLIGAPSATVTDNEIQNVTGDSGTYVAGIDIKANNAGALVQGNDVHNVTNTNPGGYGAYGINIGGTNSDGVKIVSNFVYDIGAVGYGLNEDRDIFGIRIDASNNHDVFYNSVYLSDVTTAASGAVSMAMGITNSDITGVDVQYNVFQNSMTGNPGSKSYALYGYASNFGTINTNDYYVTSPYGILGRNATTSTDLVTMTALRGFTSQDLASFSANPSFTSTTDLHINSGTNPTPLESAGTLLAGYTTDIDGDVRPGPAGSVNGGGTAPDLGADEFDGVVLGGSGVRPMFYSASYASQVGGYMAANSTNNPVVGIEVVMINAGLPLSATEFQFSTTGSTNPLTDLAGARLYYTGTSDVFSTQTPFGSLVQNPNGTFSFTGTQVMQEGTNYFWLTYDVPAGATRGDSLDAQFLNLTVGDFSYTADEGNPAGASLVGGPLSGIITVGIGGDFPNFNEAFAYVNANGLAGNVTMQIISDITEPNTATLLDWTDFPANSGYTITIQPTGGVVRTVTADGPAVFNLVEVDNVIIDGVNTGGNGLVLHNTSTTGNSSGVLIGSTTTDPANNITVQGLTIVGDPTSAYPTFGVLVSDGNVLTGSPAFNADNINISNNTILGFDYGIYVNGDHEATSDNLVIAGNTLGGNGAGQEISTVGITVIGSPNAQVTGNTIVNVTGDYGTYVAGIDIQSNNTGTVVSGNDVQNVFNSNPAGYGAFGINIGGTGTDSVTVVSNFVSGVGAVGFELSEDRDIIGIRVDAGDNHNVFFNSVYLSDATTATGGAVSMAFAITNPAVTGVDVQYNLFQNSTTGAAGTASYAVYGYAGNFGTINTNDYFVTGVAGVLGFNATGSSAISSLSGWQTFTTQDMASLNVDPQFTSTTDLHINAGMTPSPLESAGAIMPSYTTDIDGDVRPGPAGSVNGGGTAPDLGADEFDGVVYAPSMVYASSTASQIGGYIPQGSTNEAVLGIEIVTTNANNPINATSFSFTTNGTTNPSIDLTGARLWYTGTSDAFATTTAFGSVVSNPDGTFSFTGTQPLAEGTNYFWLTYDVPSGATPNDRLDAEFVNVTVGASTYTPTVGAPSGDSRVGGPLSGIYTVGTGGDFINFTEAFDYINTFGFAGDVTLNIISDIIEPAAPALNEWAEFPASSGYTLTIQPTGGEVRTVSVDGPAVFTFADADRVTVDGLNTGGNGLVLNNTSTSANSAAIVIGASSTDEASNITVQNLTLVGNPAATHPTYGILVSDGTVTTASPAFNADNLNILNNTLLGFDYGIYVNGSATGTSDNLVISGNTLGGTGVGQEISTVGITVIGAPASLITNNEIVNVSGNAGDYVAGIDLGSNTAGSTITGNDVHGVTSTIYGAFGINLGGTTNADGITISNNLVYDIVSDGGAMGPATTFNAYGIRIEGGANHDVYHNSVNMTGTTNNTTTGADPAAFLVVNSYNNNLDVRNNIFANSMTGQPGSESFAVVAPSTNVFTTSNYNVYWVSGTNGVLASNGSDLTSLGAWQSYTGQDALSVNDDPRFTSGTDLTIAAGSLNDPTVSAASNMALPIPSVPTDVTGAPRSTFYTDAGAYEFNNQNRVLTTAGPVYGGYDNLNLNGTGTFTLATTSPATVSGTLTFTNGLLDLGTNTLNLGPDVTIGGTPGTGSMIVTSGTGTVHQYVDGPGTYTLPLGETTGTTEYAPATVTVNGGSFTPNGSYFTLEMVDAKHPQNVAVTGSDYLSRYWMFDVVGMTGYNLSFDLQYTDDDVSGTESSVKGAIFGTGWTQAGTVNTGSNTLSFTNITNAPYDFTGTSEYASNAKLIVTAKALLQGAFNGTGLTGGYNNTDSTMVLLPTVQPYSDMLWGYPGTENVPGAGYFAARPQILDWVLVELRTGDPTMPPMTVVDRRAAFITTTGAIVDLDGVSPLAFTASTPGNYYLVVRHRNHLAVMSANAMTLSLASTLFDFTQSGNSYGVDSQWQVAPSVYAMIAGDASGDGFIDINDFTDADNNQFNSGYLLYDANLDGFIDINDFTDADNHQFLGTLVP